jgi:hypothetical protein
MMVDQEMSRELSPESAISANAESAVIIENLAMMLRRMIWLAEKQTGDNSMTVMAGNAKQLLAKYNLEGSALRASTMQTGNKS